MIAWLLLACAAPVTELEAVVGEAGRVAVTGYASVAEQAEVLSGAVDALCAAPSEPALSQAQDAWRSARVAWKRMEMLKFGPVVDEPLRFGPKLDDAPTNVDALEALLYGSESFEGLGDRLGSTTRGFPALEWLLWVELAEFDGTRRCELTAALADDLADNASALHAAWAPAEGNYVASLSLPDLDSGGFSSRNAVVAELVNRAAFTVEDIRNEKLGKPAGVSSGGVTHPESVESPYAMHSLADARSSLDGVRQFVLGSDAGVGLTALIPRRRAELVTGLAAAFDDAALDLAAIPEPLSTAVDQQPEAIVTAMDALQTVQVLLQADVTELLGVTVQFNDSDGD